MSIAPRLKFVTVAGHAIGLGHLNRCLAVAEMAAAMGLVPDFVVFGDASAVTAVAAAGYSCRAFPLADLSDATDERFHALGRTEAMLLDIVHPYLFDEEMETDVFVAARRVAKVLAAIDSLGEEAIAKNRPGALLDLLIVPYVVGPGDARRVADVGKRQLFGPEYALLSEDYQGLPERVQSPAASRVLVTCGGSDPTSATLAVLDGLERSSSLLEVHVVVGPLFSASLREAVVDAARNSRHAVSLVAAPESLREEMLWCEVAVAASGLTKYELAATGTPALLFSIGSVHEANNRPFTAMGTAVDIGIGPEPRRVAVELANLLSQQETRALLSAAGRRMVDGNGTRRLIAEIRKELAC